MTQTNATETAEMTTAQRDQLIQAAINDISHIATLPEITVRIVELVENPESTAHDLHLLISNDPALSARVLKVVNSAFYALPGQIGSINRAIVLLGLNAVKNIAIAASLAKLFRGGQLCPGFSARELWEHSIGVAAGVRLLSEKVSIGLPDEAFLSGLIHDIGIMVEMQARRAKLAKVFEYYEAGKGSVTFRQAEHAVFGVTHEQFGQALCEKWKFPDFLCEVAGYHHRPMSVTSNNKAIVSLVHAADVIAARQGVGYCKTVDKLEFNDGVLDTLKLTDAMIEEVQENLPAAIEDAEQLMS